MNLLRSEWIKLWSVRSHQVMLGLAVLLSMGFAGLVSAVVPNDPEQLGPDFDPFTFSLSGAGIATLLVGSVGVLLMSGEYRHGTTRVTFAAEPHRARVLVAKGAVGFAAGVLVGLLAVPLALATGLTIFSLRDFDVSVGGGTFWRAAVGAVVLFGLNALIGLGLGAILKSAAAGIVVFAIANVLVEPILDALFGRWARFLPFRAGAEIISRDPVDPGLGWALGLAYFSAWIAALLVIGGLLVSRRDA